MDRDALVEKMAIAAAGLAWVGASSAYREALRTDMRAALAVAEPVVREWCAKVADDYGPNSQVAQTIAAAIRTGGEPR